MGNLVIYSNYAIFDSFITEVSYKDTEMTQTKKLKSKKKKSQQQMIHNPLLSSFKRNVSMNW